VAQVNGAA
jgi:hypothetical protein